MNNIMSTARSSIPQQVEEKVEAARIVENDGLLLSTEQIHNRRNIEDH